MVSQVPLFQLEGGLQSYEWGKEGEQSLAAMYASAVGTKIDGSKPYAELWMGTHPTAPSVDMESGMQLQEKLAGNKMLMSHPVAQKYGNRLPFLFKILSIKKALSIQAHPNKKLASMLHTKDPEHYGDDNHKPEMAIAITDFEGFCGFRPLNEISSFISSVPELSDILGEAANSFQDAVTRNIDKVNGKKALQEAFKSLMTTKAADIEKLANKLVARAKAEGASFAGKHGGKEFADLIIRLDSQFPQDIGLFVALFLNFVKLKPGEAMFLRADDIHAYLAGDIVECMAASNNVVRAGFTPKFKDVDTLVDMLTYSYAPISEQKMQPEKFDRAEGEGSTLLYNPPIDEFAVLKTDLAKGQMETIHGLHGPSILIVTSGNGVLSVGHKTRESKEGFIYFIGATAELQMKGASDKSFITHRAFCEV